MVGHMNDMGNERQLTDRAKHEIAHGRFLASSEATEGIWGWGTPAGQVRAARRAAYIMQGAHLEANRRALEIGCGTGLFTSYFAETGAHITAVDISPELLEKARERKLAADKVTYVEGRFEDLATDEGYDAIIGSSVLHHLEVEQSLQVMFRLLTPGGRISFAEPNMLNPQIFCERHFRRFFPQVSPDETAFVRWALARKLREIGFDTISIKPFDWLHPATPKSWISCVSSISRVLERVPIVREFSGSLWISARRPLT